MRTAPKHWKVDRIDLFFAIILGDLLRTDPYRFNMTGMPNVSPLSETAVGSGCACGCKGEGGLAFPAPLFTILLGDFSEPPLFRVVAAWDLPMIFCNAAMDSGLAGPSSKVSAEGSFSPANHIFVKTYCSVVTNSLEF